MSDTQAKATPSKAARELAKSIDADWELVPNNGFHFADTVSAQERILREAQNDAIEQVAGTIQSALSDLLEKATRREWLLSRIIDDLPSNKDWLDPSLELEARNDTSLKSALEPWKPGE